MAMKSESTSICFHMLQASGLGSLHHSSLAMLDVLLGIGAIGDLQALCASS